MSQEIKIETGIPIPDSRPKGTISALLREMKSGESFIHKSQSAISSIARSAGVKIVTRKQPDGTYRVWKK